MILWNRFSAFYQIRIQNVVRKTDEEMDKTLNQNKFTVKGKRQ